ncbi:uncharacterized protein LOC134333766 isoform X5 [Trichomycterus rosablanca]|uniref:uncharacterized protein LOC134333766 isoform X5 n=1 Tax=Trichomycterus rosablanca TaxID=2290929 RepID=UPI002F35C393
MKAGFTLTLRNQPLSQSPGSLAVPPKYSCRSRLGPIHWEKGRKHPRQVASPSQGRKLKRQEETHTDIGKTCKFYTEKTRTAPPRDRAQVWWIALSPHSKKDFLVSGMSALM